MRKLIVGISISVLSLFAGRSLSAGDTATSVSRVLEQGQVPDDARLGKLRNLRDKYHPWKPAATKTAWEQQAGSIRERLLISNGLWPMPPKHPIRPTIHGKIDRGDYTIEKVFFASHPGHYVTGNLYRPKSADGKLPGVLCPHGHWSNGRFYDAGEEKAQGQLDKGAEKTHAGARYPVQARMVQLARMGCVVFHYDMVGNADSKQIGHASGFTDVEAGLRLQNAMGLQTFNSIRALDFLTSLPNVDTNRIGVTGASGGGTQTFMLCALDPRPAAAFPAVMVSTAMQGGCVCENADYLRIGINNIAIAALFAPKPMALSGANDWTIDIETKGLPELRHVYGLYGRRDLIHAKAYPQFNHNYNRVAREMMYNWFNEHLALGLDSPVVERDFEPTTPSETSVFNDQHPLPGDAQSVGDLRAYLASTSDAEYDSLVSSLPNGMKEYREVVGRVSRVMFGSPVTDGSELQIVGSPVESLSDNVKLHKGLIGRSGAGDQIPYVALEPEEPAGTAVLWIDGKGKSHLFGDDGLPKPAVTKLLEAGMWVASADVLGTGEYVKDQQSVTKQEVDSKYHGYTFGYNRPMLSHHVGDVLTAIAGLSMNESTPTLHLVGTGGAGVWTLLARASAGNMVERTLVDVGGFHFAGIESPDDPMFLPGAVKYGDVGGLAALAAPAGLSIWKADSLPSRATLPLVKAYEGRENRLEWHSGSLDAETVVNTLIR